MKTLMLLYKWKEKLKQEMRAQEKVKDMKNLTKKIYSDYLRERNTSEENTPLDGKFLDDAIAKVAKDNNLDFAEAETHVIQGLAESKNVDVVAIIEAFEKLREKRKAAHSEAEDWKESLMAEREAIELEQELL